MWLAPSDPQPRPVAPIWLGALLCLAAGLLQAANPVRPGTGDGRPVVIAHRGEHTLAPENSLAAITNAIAARVDYVELDVRPTRDAVLVLMHDSTVNRTTTGEGRVSELAWKELEGLRLRGPKGQLTNLRVPRFEAALEAMRGKIGLYLDHKGGERAAIVHALRVHGMVEATHVYCDTSDIPAWRALEPRLRFIVSPEPGAEGIEQLAKLDRSARPDVLDGDVTEYTAARVVAAHQAGFRVWPDIQGPRESEAYWRPLTRMGFDGLQSDDPAGLVRFLDKVE